MFRRLSIISVLVLLSVISHAQSTTFGLSMGANFSNLVGREKIKDSKPRIGMCPGVHLSIPLAYESYLELSAIYSQQGVVIKSDEWVKSDHVKMTLSRYVDYVTIPVLWKQTYGDLYVKAGPFASLALKASAKMVADTLNYNKHEHYDSSKDPTGFADNFNQSFINSLRQFDVGASFGVGFQTAITNGMDLFIDASYKIGFFSVEENPKTINNPLRNQYFSVSAGVYFVKNRKSRTYRRRR